jgi:enoyl-CoA hydratase
MVVGGRRPERLVVMDHVTTEVADHVAVVTFCRPPVNATDEQSWHELSETFRTIADSRDVRVVIFTACGNRAFMAGQDLNTNPWAGENRGPAQLLDPGRVVRDAMWAVYDCPVPVIAAVNGPAIGGGLAMVALCDIIIAAEGARFGVTEINVGVLGAASQLLRIVGNHKAREMFFTGELVPAEDLRAAGCIRAVVPPDQLLVEARALALTIAAKSPIAVRLAKESINRIEGLPLKEAYRLEQDYTNRLRTFDDAAEAARAYIEKRPGVWRWS